MLLLLLMTRLMGGQSFVQEPQPVPGTERAPPEHAPSWLMPIQTLDRQLPPWFLLGGEYRSRLEQAGHNNFGARSDTYLLSQLRLWLVIRPKHWFTLVGEMQDARIFFNQIIRAAPPYQNTWDIRQAYVQIGSATDGWWAITAGRQIFRFGEERLIGPSDWLNMGRTFDAVRADLHRGPNEVSVFASSVIVARDGVVDHHLEGNNLHGIYGSFKALVPRATVEPYVLWRVAPAAVRLDENAGRGALNEVTTGLHWTGQLPSRCDYGLEIAIQRGSLGSSSIESWAGHWVFGKTFAARTLQPRLFLESNYASGTKNPASHSWGTFDQLYPSSHDKLGFADQFGWRNIQQIRTGVDERLGKNWKLKQTYENFWLASERDGLYGASGALRIAAPPAPVGRHIAQEIDLVSEYQVNEALSGGFGYARVFTGEFLKKTTPGKDYNYPYAYVTYRF